MEGTADAAERQSDRLSGFANKIKGAMAAIVAGLAVGAAGVLSQVPVIGEAFAGLKSVFTAFALQIDKKLRPGLSKLNTELFELSNAIMEGNYKKAKKELGDIANLFSNINIRDTVDGARKAISNFINNVNWTKVGDKVIQMKDAILDTLVTQFGKFEENISADDVEDVTSGIIDFLVVSFENTINATDWSQFILDIIDLMLKISEGVSKAIKNSIAKPLWNAIAEAFGDFVDGAKEWGEDIIDNMIEGINNKASELGDAITGINIAGDLTVGDVADKAASLGGGGGGNNGGNTTVNNPMMRGASAGGGDTYLDGRKMTEENGRYRSDASLRRGI
jgi:hypothetical protein